MMDWTFAGKKTYSGLAVMGLGAIIALIGSVIGEDIIKETGIQVLLGGMVLSGVGGADRLRKESKAPAKDKLT